MRLIAVDFTVNCPALSSHSPAESLIFRKSVPVSPGERVGPRPMTTGFSKADLLPGAMVGRTAASRMPSGRLGNSDPIAPGSRPPNLRPSATWVPSVAVSRYLLAPLQSQTVFCQPDPGNDNVGRGCRKRAVPGVKINRRPGYIVAILQVATSVATLPHSSSSRFETSRKKR